MMDDANAARYYANFPVVFFEQLTDEFMSYLKCDNVAAAKNHMMVAMYCCADESWNRVFKSLQPYCPVDFKVFVDFDRAISDQDEDTYRRMLLGDVRYELRIFALWIEAKQLWEERPSDDDSRLHLMRTIDERNPNLRMKGEPDSIMKRFRQECKEKGLPGISESEGLKLIREIRGLKKRRRRTD